MNNIDVAKIMAEITSEAANRYSDAALEARKKEQCSHIVNNAFTSPISATNTASSLQGELCQAIKANNHMVAMDMASLHTYGDIPWSTPDYGWKHAILKRPLRFIAKTVSKLTRFITTRQKSFNDTTVHSLELLQASVLHMADWSADIEKTIKNMSSILEAQHDMLQYLNHAMNVQIPNDMYLAFEERHRGSQEDIEKKQLYYFNHYVKNKICPDSVGMVVDLGCGRGEWLYLLKKNGYYGIGVDLNDASLKCCEQNGVMTVKLDVIEYLKTLPGESVKLLTSFQLIEHLNTNQLMELCTEIGRVLRMDGLVILETPNPENVTVGASSFYLDPTHKRPVHPELLRFLAEQNGLAETEIAYWQREEFETWWESIWSKDITNLPSSIGFHAIEETLKKSLWSPADYALIAKKTKKESTNEYPN